eukprot:168268-Amphidinium_carterae.4
MQQKQEPSQRWFTWRSHHRPHPYLDCLKATRTSTCRRKPGTGLRDAPKAFSDKLRRFMEQTAYIQAIRPCSIPELQGKPPEHPLDEPQRRRYLSSIMTLAYTTLSRPDLAIFVAGLQRPVLSLSCERFGNSIRSSSGHRSIHCNYATCRWTDSAKAYRGVPLCRSQPMDWTTTGRRVHHLIDWAATQQVDNNGEWCAAHLQLSSLQRWIRWT